MVMKQITRIILQIFIILYCLIANSADKTNMTGVSEGFYYPVYNSKTNKLQFIIYGDKAESFGTFNNLTGVLLDYVKKDLKNVSDVTQYHNLKVYSITENVDNIAQFWKNKLHTQTLIETPSADYNISSGLIKGKEDVFVRSPEMDIDGVGFNVSSSEQVLHILKDVNITMRGELNRETLKYNENPVKATSDSLDVNMKDNQIILRKNVVIKQNDSIILCDETYLFLRKDVESISNDQGKGRAGNEKVTLSRAICKGSVCATRKDENGIQNITANSAEYDFKKEVIYLTQNPEVKQGESLFKGEKITLWKGQNILEIEDNAYLYFVSKNKKNQQRKVTITSNKMIFNRTTNIAECTGNVKVEDHEMTMESDYLKVFFTKSVVDNKEQLEIARSLIIGDVHIKRFNKELNIDEKIDAGHIDYIASEQKMILTKKPIVYRNNNIMKGNKILLLEKEERVLVEGDGYIKLTQTTENNKQNEYTIRANKIDIDSKNNVVTFNSSVNADYMLNSEIKCEYMKLFLKNKTNLKKEKEKENTNKFINKEVVKMICKENVIAKRTVSDDEFERLLTPYLTYDAISNKIELTGAGSLVIRNKSQVTGDKIILERENNQLKNIIVLFNAIIEFVDMDIKDKERKGKSVVCADYINWNNLKSMGMFNENVVATDKLGKLKCDSMLLFTEKVKEKLVLDKAICIGNVFIERNVFDENNIVINTQKAIAGKADYNMKDGKVELTENPELIQETDNLKGNKIILWENKQEIIGNVKGNMKYDKE